MGFGLECPLIQFALTMDMKDFHELGSHSHLQKAFWTAGTAWYSKKTLPSRSEEESVQGLV